MWHRCHKNILLVLTFIKRTKNHPKIALWSVLSPSFVCSKLLLETLEHGVKYVQSQQKRHQNGANDIEQILHLVLVFLLLSLNVWLSAELLPKVLTTANHWHAAIKSSNFIKLSYAVVITTIKFHKKSQSYIQSQNCYTWFSKSTLTIWAI